MVSYKIQEIIKGLYDKCETTEEVIKLEEEIQGINSSIAGAKWTYLTTED